MFRLLVIGFFVLFIISCSSRSGNYDYKNTKVSWYGKKFHGRKTASGEVYNMRRLTAAHKTLPFGTRVKIINPENNKKVIVKITDRGPFVEGREFDLSKRAFRKIAPLDKGVMNVKYKILR